MLRTELLDHLDNATLQRFLVEDRWVDACAAGAHPVDAARALLNETTVDLMLTPEEVIAPTGEWVHNPNYDNALARRDGAHVVARMVSTGEASL